MRHFVFLSLEGSVRINIYDSLNYHLSLIDLITGSSLQSASCGTDGRSLILLGQLDLPPVSMCFPKAKHLEMLRWLEVYGCVSSDTP